MKALAPTCPPLLRPLSCLFTNPLPLGTDDEHGCDQRDRLQISEASHMWTGRPSSELVSVREREPCCCVRPLSQPKQSSSRVWSCACADVCKWACFLLPHAQSPLNWKGNLVIETFCSNIPSNKQVFQWSSENTLSGHVTQVIHEIRIPNQKSCHVLFLTGLICLQD